MVEAAGRVPHEPLAKLFLRFLRFGCLAWGGPVAQIAMIRQELVEEEKWITKERFNRVLAVYQALPGPEAHEMCVYFGMLSRGQIGAFLAGLAFMLPGFVLMFALSWAYLRYGINYAWFAAVLAGFQPAVVALITRAVHRIGQHAVTNRMLLLCAGMMALAEICRVPFYIPLLIAGTAYSLAAKSKRAALLLITIMILSSAGWMVSRSQSGALETGATFQPTLLNLLISGFRTGLLTFGGAYTAIPFMRHDAVVAGGWVTNPPFLDGLALSGILPAPLIIFSTFVGYLGGGPAGAVLITLGVFLPAFAFTMLGYKSLEKIIDYAPLHRFLDGLAAGVTGLIAVTALRLLPQALSGIKSALIFTAALIVLYRWKHKGAIAFVMLGAGLAGLLLSRLPF